MSDRQDKMPGEPEIVICGEALYHLLARTLKLMMQEESSAGRPQPQPSSASRPDYCDKYLQHVQSNHRILASFVVIKLYSFYPLSSQKRLENTLRWRESQILMTFPGSSAMSEYFSIFLITVT